MLAKIVFFVIILFAVQNSILNAQPKINPGEYNFYNSTSFSFYSETVKDSFEIYVSLPDGYDETQSDYPVLYVLDGDISFEIVTSIARYLQVGNNIPELIIVGIGYGTLNKEAGNNRQRDYSPTAVGNDINTGGAQNFLDFLQDELIPYIDSNYRTDKSERTIYGYSLAGLFCFYNLFTQPALFNNYIIGSAYLNWDNKVIFEIEKQSAIRTTDINANVFISVGDDEDNEKYFDPIDEMVSALQDRNYKSLNISTMVFNNEDHLTTPPLTIVHGLLSIFQK
jgi:predicted alpha/beta superfamily hydrolase